MLLTLNKVPIHLSTFVRFAKTASLFDAYFAIGRHIKVFFSPQLILSVNQLAALAALDVAQMLPFVAVPCENVDSSPFSQKDFRGHP